MPWGAKGRECTGQSLDVHAIDVASTAPHSRWGSWSTLLMCGVVALSPPSRHCACPPASQKLQPLPFLRIFTWGQMVDWRGCLPPAPNRGTLWNVLFSEMPADLGSRERVCTCASVGLYVSVCECQGQWGGGLRGRSRGTRADSPDFTWGRLRELGLRS